MDEAIIKVSIEWRYSALILSSTSIFKQVAIETSSNNSIRIKRIKKKMKFSQFFIACLVSADEKKVPPRHPLQRLDRLVQFSDEILNSGAFNNKSDKWINNWSMKFARNADRMEINFKRGNQRCGFYDQK